MARFVTTTGGELINIDHVAKAKPFHDGSYERVVLYNTEGNVLGTLAGSSEQLHFTGGLVPAYPGWSLISIIDAGDDDGGLITEEPIIAFNVAEDSIGTMPYTLEGTPANKSEPWAIKRPDGTLVNTQEQDWKSIEEFANDHRNRAKAERKKA